MTTQNNFVYQKNFSNVNVVLADSDHKERAAIEKNLVKIGFKNILSTENCKEVRQAIMDGQVDLLICDTVLQDGCLIDLVHSMRLGALGGNMFPLVISIISKSTADIVHRVIDSGSDAILVKPFCQNDLYDRIYKLVNKREDFVVTSDYIGPNRRKAHRAGTQVIPKVTVPNPLRNKVTEFYSQAEYNIYVERTATTINEQRIKRQSHHIGYLVDKIQPAEGEATSVKGMPSEWKNLVYTANDLSTRVKSSQFSHMGSITVTLINFVNEMDVAGTLQANDFRLLTHLSNGISRGVALN